jgi:hypothetical protein
MKVGDRVIIKPTTKVGDVFTLPNGLTWKISQVDIDIHIKPKTVEHNAM